MVQKTIGWPRLLTGLCVAVVLAGGIVAYANPWIFAQGVDAGQVMSVQAAHTKASAGEIVLVDVRYPREWRKTGLPASGHAITMHQEGAVFISALKAAVKGDTSKPVAVICATGGRTTYLQGVLRNNGFQNPINVGAGMLGSKHGVGWLEARLPTREWDGQNAAPVLAKAD